MNAAYYNEIDEFAAAWLKALIDKGLIARGDVDSRDIRHVRSDDLRGYSQCHFFAGIGGWSVAFRLAGLPDDFAAWSGSCPCQPFSAAGAQRGAEDERHLWPELFRIIAECRPSIVFGEQVASSLGRLWLTGVRNDLESLDYAVGAADLCAAGVGAPHPRQRLYWLAHSDGWDASAKRLQRGGEYGFKPKNGGRPERLANARHEQEGRRARPRQTPGGRPFGELARLCDDAERLGDAESPRLQGEWRQYSPGGERHRGLTGLAMQDGVPEWNGPTVAVRCSDGARRVSAQSNAFPLANGVSGRVGKLRAYGNAIVPQVAAEFIAAALECAP